MFLCKGTDSSFLSAFVDVVSSMILCAMSIIVALMVTLGFMVWCQNMTQRFPSCEMAAGQAIDIQDGIDTSGFYIQLGTAQVHCHELLQNGNSSISVNFSLVLGAHSQHGLDCVFLHF